MGMTNRSPAHLVKNGRADEAIERFDQLVTPAFGRQSQRLAQDCRVEAGAGD
jgi:hypothetical protein